MALGVRRKEEVKERGYGWHGGDNAGGEDLH